MPIALKTTSLPDAVYEALRESIVLLQDAPGSVLSETAVATRYGVARPTAKAAVERLVTEGFLRREAHRAARVPQFSRADIEDLYASRAVIEEAALGNLARDGDLPYKAESAHRELLEIARAGRPGFARADVTFHRELVVGQRSPRLTRMHALIMGEVELCIGQLQAHQLLRASEVAEQHQGILDAVQLGDEGLTRALTRQHIETSRDRLLAKYDADHQPGH
jgi:DNA-binding GntR family transcriptional regulator